MKLDEQKKIKILDCSLRDGGYYNNWDFDRELVKNYLLALNKASIDIVELGFRSLPQSTFMGPYRYTTDHFIETLDLPDGPIYGVMIDGKEFLSEENNLKNSINKLFLKKNYSKISLVRIAIHFNDAYKVETIAKHLKELGYHTAINLMQAHGKNTEDYETIAKKISSWNVVDILYFADSLGNMIPKDVKKICNTLNNEWNGILGIHAHNNKSLALINSITALENGATWCDSTISGMGRGAGNVPTESLFIEMSQIGKHKGNASFLVDVVEDFNKLKKNYGWGPNIYYHFASNNNIHPTYVQALLADKRYDNQQILGALDFLSKHDSTSYTEKISLMALYGNEESVKGEWNATDWLKNEEVLLVGAGPSVKQHKEGILNYVKKKKPAVLFLNFNRFLPQSIGRATLICHDTRTMLDAQLLKDLKHPLIMPVERLGKIIKSQLENLTIYDYGLSLKKGSFEISTNDCHLEWGLAVPYALSVVTQAGAKKINLVGFDGFESDDPRQEEMNEVFKKYQKLNKSIQIVSLTPTSYRIKKSSIYSPIDE